MPISFITWAILGLKTISEFKCQSMQRQKPFSLPKAEHVFNNVHCSMAHSKLQYPFQAVVDCDLCESHIKVDWYCTTCPANLCEKCMNLHTSRSNFKKHKVGPRQQVTPKKKDWERDRDNGEFERCSVHKDREATLTCVKCKLNVCSECIVKRHNGHELESVADGLKKLGSELSKYVKDLQSKDTELSAKRNRKAEDMQNMRANTKTTRQQIVMARQLQIEDINKAYDVILDRLDMHTSEQEKDFAKSNEEEDKTQEGVRSLIERAQYVTQRGNMSEIRAFISSSPDPDSFSTRHPFSPSLPQFRHPEPRPSPITGTLIFEELNPNPIKSNSGLKTNEVKVLRTFNAGETTTEIRCIGSTQSWCSHFVNKSLTLLDNQGKELKCINLDFNVQGFVMSDKGGFIVCDMPNQCIISVTSAGEVTTLCSTSPHSPWGICLNHKQQLVVCLGTSLAVYSADGRSKVVEFTQNRQGQPLFKNAYRVAQNGNHDYCVVDRDADTVLAIDAQGNLRWTYTGGPGREGFRPMNVCCDKHQHVIIADYNNKVHLVDKDGLFIMHLMTKENVSCPWGLSVADDGVLWVGEQGSKKIHLIRYM